ncbi:MAG TPA: hypothetical protein VFH83_08265 [Spirochaetia bacterium]|nr:hypothetical protein [Spirochaetia bacterium]
MRRVAPALLCLAIPALLLLNAWQGSRYGELLDQVSALEDEQSRLLRANQDAIARIAYEEAPERVAEKAAAVSGLVPADPANVLRVTVAGTPAAGGQP